MRTLEILPFFPKFFYYHIITVLGVYCDIYKRLTIYISQIHLSPSFSFILPPPTLRIILTGLIFFPFSYISIYFHYIHPPSLLPCILPHLTGTTPPDRTHFTFLCFVFEKRHFCLFKMAVQGVSLWCFYARTYYIPNWLIPSIFLLSTLVPLLRWFQQI
jgi:hypothetical protein